MAMRDEIKVAIEAGGATKETLLKLTGTTEKGLASQFTYMRMMGICPMKQEDGTFKIVSSEEWEAHKSESGSTSTINLTPAQRVEKAEKKSARAATAFDNAKTQAEKDPKDRMKELKFIKAQAELEIAELELGAAEATFANAPPEEIEVAGDSEKVEEAEEAEKVEEEEDLS